MSLVVRSDKLQYSDLLFLLTRFLKQTVNSFKQN